MKLLGKFCRAYLDASLHRGRGGCYGGVIKKVIRKKPRKGQEVGELISVTLETPAFGRIRVWPAEVNNQFTGSTCGVMYRNKLLPLE